MTFSTFDFREWKTKKKYRFYNCLVISMTQLHVTLINTQNYFSFEELFIDIYFLFFQPPFSSLPFCHSLHL
ncbi:unnamed protein product, partial [Gulo gulo]